MMADPDSDSEDLPVWARESAFPEKPSEGTYGFPSGEEMAEVPGPEALREVVRKMGAPLVWTPETRHCVYAGEIEWLREPLLHAGRERAERHFQGAKKTAFIVGALALVMMWQGGAFSGSAGGLVGFLKSSYFATSLLLFTIFAGLPLYDAWKMRRSRLKMTVDDFDQETAVARFELWLGERKAPFTKLCMGAMVVAGLCQFLIFTSADWILATSLLKQKVLEGEWWRYLTAPFTHGNLVHWLFNASALWYLGKRTEVLARWPHVPIVLVVSGFAGGLMSMSLIRYYPQPSVGASGAIVGLLGFLLVFESLHRRLVPRSASRRLMAMVFGLIVIGLVGVQMIDNGAHAGGLLAGLIYGLIVFPSSKSARRPIATGFDVIAGSAALVAIAGALCFTVLRLANAA